MKTLEQHNSERMENYKFIERKRLPHPNGVECPKCGSELWDSDPTAILASNPPQKNIHCPACGYVGFRLA